MKPGKYDIEIYRGDTYRGPPVTLPDLSAYGGPSTLAGATVSAEIRVSEMSEDVLATFGVEILNAPSRQFRLGLTPSQTAALSLRNAVWDLEVTKDGWVGTLLRGSVYIYGQVTR